MKSATQLVDEIESKSKSLYLNLDDSETISKTLFELAVLSMGLGNHLIEAQDADRVAETLYKHNMDEAIALNSDMPFNKAELEAKRQLHSEKVRWNEAKRQVDVLKIKRGDLDKVIDTGRSRLSLIKGDIRKEI
jgi:Mg/Co/Ni transporter MgtE